MSDPVWCGNVWVNAYESIDPVWRGNVWVMAMEVSVGLIHRGSLYIYNNIICSS